MRLGAVLQPPPHFRWHESTPMRMEGSHHFSLMLSITLPFNSFFVNHFNRSASTIKLHKIKSTNKGIPPPHSELIGREATASPHSTRNQLKLLPVRWHHACKWLPLHRTGDMWFSFLSWCTHTQCLLGNSSLVCSGHKPDKCKYWILDRKSSEITVRVKLYKEIPLW